MNINPPLDAAIRNAGVVGAVAFVGDRDGVRFEGAYGSQAPAAAKPMQLNTMFQLASMTKAIASVAAMQLVERGLLALDAPIGTLLPALADPMVIDGFAPDGSAILRKARAAITLRHLLSHSCAGVVEPQEIRFSTLPHGKPIVAEPTELQSRRLKEGQFLFNYINVWCGLQ